MLIDNFFLFQIIRKKKFISNLSNSWKDIFFDTFKKRMGNGMDKILPGLYVGSVRDSNDKEQLSSNKITHILTIHDDPRPDGAIKVKLLFPFLSY